MPIERKPRRESCDGLGRVVAGLVLWAGWVRAETGQMPLRWVEPWGAVFGGEQVTLHAQGAPGTTRAGWALAVAGAVVARGEVDCAGGPAPVRVTLPPVRDGITVEGVLTLEAGATRASKRLWVFGADPWMAGREAIRALGLRVFDPAGGTAARLEQAELPFKPLRSLDALTAISNGVVIVGEGLSLVESKALGRVATQAARQGARVLWLAPREGAFVLPGAAGDDVDAVAPTGAVPCALGLRRTDIVSALEKRLTADDWRSGPPAATTLHVTGARRRVEGEWRPTADGWVWLDARWSGGGRLIVCSLRVIEAWEQGPAARYWLAALLNDMRQ